MTTPNTKRKERTVEFENTTPEQIELTQEQLEVLAGGAAELGSSSDRCPKSRNNRHYWYDTGETRPSKFWTDDHPERKLCCKNCGAIVWQRVLVG